MLKFMFFSVLLLKISIDNVEILLQSISYICVTQHAPPYHSAVFWAKKIPAHNCAGTEYLYRISISDIHICIVGNQVVSRSMIRVKSMILRTEEGEPSRLEMTLVEISTLDSMIMLSRLVSLG